MALEANEADQQPSVVDDGHAAAGPTRHLRHRLAERCACIDGSVSELPNGASKCVTADGDLNIGSFDCTDESAAIDDQRDLNMVIQKQSPDLSDGDIRTTDLGMPYRDVDDSRRSSVERGARQEEPSRDLAAEGPTGLDHLRELRLRQGNSFRFRDLRMLARPRVDREQALRC